MPDRTQEPDRRLGIDDSIEEPDETMLLRLEEEADVRASGWRGVGFLRASKRVETVRVEEAVAQDREALDLERLPAAADDPGGVLTLEDGGISIPVYEEEVIVTRRVVLKERVVIRKRVETHTVPVSTEVRRERVEIDVDREIEDRVRIVGEERPGAAD